MKVSKVKKRNDSFSLPLMYLSGGFTVPEEKEKGWLKRTKCTHRAADIVPGS